MTAERVLLVAAVLLALLLSRLLCRWLRLVKPNFQNTPIPAAAGLSFVVLLIGLLVYRTSQHLPYLRWEPYVRVNCLLLGFGLLGFIDDRWGDRSVGGFRGHLKRLFSRRPTTGGIKLVGGGLLALWYAWPKLREPDQWDTWPAFLVAAAVIALSANTLNLLDLRPGRAFFGFFVLLLPLILLGQIGFLWSELFWPLSLLILIEWPLDARARAMLGDTGSNLLGAFVGASWVGMTPLWAQLVLLAVLVGLNLLAERRSLSQLIRETPWLNWLDHRLGVR